MDEATAPVRPIPIPARRKRTAEEADPQKAPRVPFVIVERVAQWIDQYRVVMVDPEDHPNANGNALRAAAEAQHFEHGSDYIEAVSGDLVDFIGVAETKVARLCELSDLPNEVRDGIQAAIGKEAEEDFIKGRGPHDDWREREGRSA